MVQLFHSSEMPSMIHIYLPNMTPYKSNNWQMQSMDKIFHKIVSQADRSTSLSYENLTSYLNHKAIIPLTRQKGKTEEDKSNKG